MWATVQRYLKEIVFGLIVAAITGALAWGFWELYDRFRDRPLTASISDETSTAPFYEIQIKPALQSICARPSWEAWIGKTIFDQHCVRLVFEPPALEDMITRRVPFQETAEPDQLLELFVRHHRGCLSLRREADTIFVEEPADAQIIREGDRLICPK